ncbi:40S ribosomal protein S5-1 [Hordeum vulgare]|nr:40S ribosomal protein S5-1 [Hordeum vulgare]
MASPEVLKDKFFEKIINPYLAGVLQHPKSIEMHEGVLHIRDVEGPKKTGNVEARLEAMEQQVFKCQGMVERVLNASHMMITGFTNKHKIDVNDIGKHLSMLYDKIDHLQAQIYDLQNQNWRAKSTVRRATFSRAHQLFSRAGLFRGRWSVLNHLTVDGDEFGGTFPSRQGAGIGILVPRNLLAMAAEIRIAFGEKGSGIRVSSTGVKIGPR